MYSGLNFPADLWGKSRHGAWSGRGYRFQDAVGAWLAVAAWAGTQPIETIVPEGLEDFSVRSESAWKHVLVKSRWSHRGMFALSTVAQWLVDAWTRKLSSSNDEGVVEHILVLEQGVDGLDPTGWDQTFAQSLTGTALRDEIKARTAAERVPIDADFLLENTRLVILQEPFEDALTLLSERLEIPRAACLPHALALQSRVGELSDQNGVAPATAPQQLPVMDVARLLDQVSQLVDVEVLEHAVREGICEFVNFLAPLADDRFFEGVNVVPGHVAAGLPVERAELLEQIANGLEDRRYGLVVGPSGAGKSAALWMTVHATRQAIRWYRIRRLDDQDVNPLIRLLDGSLSSERSPIGFVVDDLGKFSGRSWDILVDEALQRPGVRLLAAIRAEDLGLVGTVGRAAITYPVLDAKLAEAIYRELHERGKTSWGHWLEPFERSAGLLLEYTHLLTQGKRLSETISEQIRRRRIEHRDPELRVLRRVACSHVWGGEISTRLLATDLHTSDEELQRTLQRLLDEHLLQRGPGDSITGLHELRSREILHWSHEIAPPTIGETAIETIRVVGSHTFQPFLVNLLESQECSREQVAQAIAERLDQHNEVEVLVAAFQSLRIAGFLRLARRWIEVLDGEEVPLAKRLVTCNLALLGATDSDAFVDSIRRAIPQMVEAKSDDPRADLIGVFKEGLLDGLVKRVSDPARAAALYASLAELSLPSGLLKALANPSISPDAKLEDMAEMLANARSVDPALAKQLVQSLGGQQELLRRLSEAPWVRNVRVVRERGERVIQAQYRYVIPREQSDPHGEVVSICRLALHLDPSADVVAVVAVDPTGKPAGFGDYRIADKRIPRKNLPSRGEISWNRARMRAIGAALATMGETERLLEEADMIGEAAQILPSAARSLCLLEAIPGALIDRMERVVRRAEDLPPALLDPQMELPPLEQGDTDTSDPTNSLISGTFGNMLPRLYEPDANPPLLVAAFIRDSLISSVRELQQPERWRLVGGPPSQPLGEIEQTLLDIHDVVVERDQGGNHGLNALLKLAKIRRADPIRDCGALARRRIEGRMVNQTQRLRKELDRRRIGVEIVRRPAKKKTFLWPPDDVGVFVAVDSLLSWGDTAGEVNNLCTSVFGDARRVILVPTRLNQVIPWLAMIVRQDGPVVIPLEPDEWEGRLPGELFAGKASELVDRLITSLEEVTSLASGVLEGELPDREAELFREATAAWDEPYAEIVEMAERDSTGVLPEIIVEIGVIAERVNEELGKLKTGQTPRPLLADAANKHLEGQQDDFVDLLLGIRLIATEWDLDPNHAADLIAD